MHSLSNILNIMSIDTTNGGSAVGENVHMIFILQTLHLLRSQSCEAEHTNLICNMTPILSGTALPMKHTTIDIP